MAPRAVRSRLGAALIACAPTLNEKAFGLGMTFIVEIVLEKVRVADERGDGPCEDGAGDSGGVDLNG